MRQFDLNKLTIDQLQDTRLDDSFVGDVVDLMLEDEWYEVTEEESEAAVDAQRLVLLQVNRLLRQRGIGVEFCEVDQCDYTDFILVNCDETEAEFVERVLS